MKNSLDVRSIVLPQRFLRALSLFISRVTNAGKSIAQKADRLEVGISNQVIKQLFGNVPLFGALADVSFNEIRNAFGVVVPPTTYTKEIATVIPHITPWTPVCEECGEFPLMSSGGKISELPVGALCPFCKSGKVANVPILLRRMHWVTGELVDPSVTDDYRTRSGVRIPLTDERIEEWATYIHPKFAGVPNLYQLLAYMNLHHHYFSEPERAANFLRDPTDKSFFLDQFTVLLDETHRFAAEREIWNVPSPYLSDGKLRKDFWPLKTGARTYLVEGLIARGDKCDVFRARWDHDPTMLVVIKALVAQADMDLIDREEDMLRSIADFDDVDSEFFRLFLPRMISGGPVVFPDGKTRTTIVYRCAHQFDWTLQDVREQYPTGIHPRTMVWMMNRLSELLGWLHSKHIVHGAILPEHILVKPSTHRIELLDWSYAAQIGQPLVAWSQKREAFYPNESIDDLPLIPVLDLAMACRCMLYVLGSDPLHGHGAGTICPEGKDVTDLVQMLYDHAGYLGSHPRFLSALEFKETFGRIAQGIYGKPAYHPFVMGE